MFFIFYETAIFQLEINASKSNFEMFISNWKLIISNNNKKLQKR